MHTHTERKANTKAPDHINFVALGYVVYGLAIIKFKVLL